MISIIQVWLCVYWRSQWPCGKAPASRAEDPGIEPHFRRSSQTSDLNIGGLILPCEASGMIGSELGLGRPVPECCKCIRLQVRFATSKCVAAHTIIKADPSLWSTLHVGGTLSNQETLYSVTAWPTVPQSQTTKGYSIRMSFIIFIDFVLSLVQ